jgi:hypothetical protein
VRGLEIRLKFAEEKMKFVQVGEEFELSEVEGFYCSSEFYSNDRSFSHSFLKISSNKLYPQNLQKIKRLLRRLRYNVRPPVVRSMYEC